MSLKLLKKLLKTFLVVFYYVKVIGKTECRVLETFKISCYRRMLKTSWLLIIRNYEESKGKISSTRQAKIRTRWMDWTRIAVGEPTKDHIKRKVEVKNCVGRSNRYMQIIYAAGHRTCGCHCCCETSVTTVARIIVLHSGNGITDNT